MKMEKKVEIPPSPPPSVGEYEDSQSTYTVDQPPPAYHKPELPAIKVAKIVAGTILIVTLIAGLTAVAIVYMQHNLKCAQLIADQESTTSELPQAAKVIQDNQELNAASLASSSEDRPSRLPYPIRVDFDEITGKMMETNRKARLSCVVEKKKIDPSKTVLTPYGNMTSASGEAMTLTCRSTNDRASSGRPKSSTGKSSTGRSTTTTTTTTEKSASGPILIRIPLSRGPLFRPQLRLIGQSGPAPSSILRRPENPLDAFFQQMTSSLNGPAPRPQSSPALNPIQLLLQGLNTLLPVPVPKEDDQAENKQENEGPRPNGLFPPMMMHQPQSSQEMPSIHRMLNPFQQIRVPMMPFPNLGGGPGPFPNADDMLPRLLEVQKRIQHERRLEEEMEQQQEQRRRQQAAGRRQKEQEARRQRVGDSSDDDSDEDDDDSPAVVTIHELRRPDGNGPVPAAESRSLRGRPEGRALPMREMHPLQRIPMPMPPMFNSHHQMAPPVMMEAHARSGPVFLHPQNPPKDMQQNRHQQEQEQQQQQQQQQPQHPLQQEQHPLQQQQLHQEQQRPPNHPLSHEEMSEIHARQHQEGNNQHPNGGQMEGAPTFHEMAHLVPPPPPHGVAGDMLMERNGHQLPFITGGHNMQPRSSAGPRVERSADACSCVCK